MECTTSGHTAELFVWGEGLRAGVFTHSLRAGMSHRFTFSGITWFVCVARAFACWDSVFLLCFCRVIPVSSREMQNCVILSMPQSWCVQQWSKKKALFPEGTVFLRIKICFLCSKDLLSSVIKERFLSELGKSHSFERVVPLLHKGHRWEGASSNKTMHFW